MFLLAQIVFLVFSARLHIDNACKNKLIEAFNVYINDKLRSGEYWVQDSKSPKQHPPRTGQMAALSSASLNTSRQARIPEKVSKVCARIKVKGEKPG